MSEDEKLNNPSPAEREQTRRIALAIVESVRADEPMAHGLEDCHDRPRPLYHHSDVEHLVFALAREVELLAAENNELADALQSLAQVTSQHGDYTQDPDYLLAARLRATGTTEGEGER